MIFGQLRKDGELRIRKRVQVIVEVEVEAGTYASEQYQSRINAPGECPNCGIAQSARQEATASFVLMPAEGILAPLP